MSNLSRIESILVAALEKGTPEARSAFLDEACGSDREVRRNVERLLHAHEHAGNFLQAVPVPVGTVDEVPVTDCPGTVIGPYKLLEQIGEGGFGIVFLAEQQQPVRRKVALKVVKPGMDTRQVVARFEAERQALALMDHPNIARVFDGGETASGRPYFVMELVRGIPITDFCDQNRLPVHGRLELFITVCQAVQHAHQRGIIHRDLKPSNVLVTLHDDKAVVKVIDFGIAKATGQHLTEKTLFTNFAQLIGTPLYMRPEQAQLSGLDVDTRSDIYALGVLLYELLTGTTPCDKERLRTVPYDEIRRILREEEPAKPSTRIGTLGQAAMIVSANRGSEPKRLSRLFRGELDWMVMKALEKDRNRRYETAGSFAADVRRYLDDEPVQACPPSAGYRLRKFTRKYRLPVTVTAGFALLLVAGVVVSTWQAVRATQAEGEAVVQRDRAKEAEQEATTKRKEAEAAQEQARKAEAHSRRLHYAVSMGLVQAAWENHNLLQVHGLLEDTAAFRERGFEWYYWQRLSRAKHLALVGHKGGVNAVTFAPASRWLATGGNDGTARIWDVASGREICCLRGHRSQVTAVAFGPDGQWLVTGSTDGTGKVWDIAGGRELRTLGGHRSGPVWAVAVTPDGRRVVTGSEDGMLRAWDAHSGQELLTLKGQMALPPLATSTAALLNAPHAPGSFLAASNLCLGKGGHTGRVWAVAVTPDGRRLVTGSEDGTARVWDAGTGREMLPPLKHTARVTSVAVSSDGQRIVTTGGGVVKLWEAINGREIPSFGSVWGRIECVTLTPDGKHVVTGNEDGLIQLWDTARGQKILTLMAQKLSRSTSVAVSPDGQRLATGCLDGTARVWEMADGPGTLSLKGHTGPVWAVTMPPDGQRIVTGSLDGTARLWDAAGGRDLRTFKGHSGGVLSVAVIPDTQRLVTGSIDGTAKVWDVVSGREFLSVDTHSGWVCAVAATPDGQRIITGGQDGTARVWDVVSGRELFTLKRHFGRVLCLSMTPDGQRLVTGSYDNTAKLWDAASGRELLTFKGHSDGVLSLAVIPDTQRLVTGSIDGTAKVWDMASGRELLSLQGHTGAVLSSTTTPDGRRIVTGSEDGTVRLWDALTGRELLALKQYAGPVESGPVNFVAVTPDGHRLITASRDGSIKIWQAASPDQTALWARQEQETARRLAVWQRPVAGAPGFIQDWLILAPLALQARQSGAEGLEREQLLGEANLQPRAGEAVWLDGRERVWRAYHGEEPVLDFNRFVGELSEYHVAYAVCYVISERERNDLLLQIGSDDQAKVYLNGQEVYKYSRDRGLFVLDPVGPITLRKGANVLVCKVVNEVLTWEGCARFVDPEGNPAQGLRMSLTPEP